MKKFFNIILAPLFVISSSNAEISSVTPANTASLTQIASSMSHSISNVENNKTINVNILEINKKNYLSTSRRT